MIFSRIIFFVFSDDVIGAVSRSMWGELRVGLTAAAFSVMMRDYWRKSAIFASESGGIAKDRRSGGDTLTPLIRLPTLKCCNPSAPNDIVRLRRGGWRQNTEPEKPNSRKRRG